MIPESAEVRSDRDRIAALEAEIVELREAIKRLSHPHWHWCNAQRKSQYTNRNEVAHVR